MSTAPRSAAPEAIMRLTDRSVIAIDGEDAASFLAGIVTCAVDEAGPARFGALLTPQGKIIADFFLIPRRDPDAQGAGFYLDAPQSVADALLKRLTMYRLRAKVRLAATELSVFASLDEAPAAAADVTSYTDPRFAPMGRRFIAPANRFGELGDPSAYETHRIHLAIPQGGRDFAYGDAFPHEAGMDQLGGVDFEKGCYVGQEVVSRTQHRGLARTRIVAIRTLGEAAAEGVAVTAGDKTLGKLGSVDPKAGRAIGLLRLDRLAEALAAGATPKAGDAQIEVEMPPWARYRLPEIAPHENPVSHNR